MKKATIVFAFVLSFGSAGVTWAGTTKGKITGYGEVGFLSSTGFQLVSFGIYGKLENIHAYGNIGFPSIVNIGAGFSSNKNGSGINLRGGFFPIIDGVSGWNSSLTYALRFKGNGFLHVGAAYVGTTNSNGMNFRWIDGFFNTFYPVVSFRGNWWE